MMMESVRLSGWRLPEDWKSATPLDNIQKAPAFVIAFRPADFYDMFSPNSLDRRQRS
jgi:hypothetical protein